MLIVREFSFVLFFFPIGSLEASDCSRPCRLTPFFFDLSSSFFWYPC
jgi:hypothetical protein